MANAITPEQYERIRAQLSAHSGFICPDCLPVLSLEATPGRWRLIVDHSPGCATYAERFLRTALDFDPEQQERLVRELDIDKLPTSQEMARWQRWAEMTDAEFEAEQGMTS